MFLKTNFRQVVMSLLLATIIAGCEIKKSGTAISTHITIPVTASASPTAPISPPLTIQPLTPAPTTAAYAFPSTIDPQKQYLFYLHGRILEDQGDPAFSPEYGAYEYRAILEELNGYDMVVISEVRPKDTDGLVYARKIAQQVMTLIKAGVPAKNITIVGASKGAAIATYVSHYLKNPEVNFVLLAICHPDNVEVFQQNEIILYGNVLSIYDSNDTLAGSCERLFALSEGKGLARHQEIVLEVGTGHGVLYKPLDEWITPTVEWARQR
jgi:hypothetical protein